VGGWVFGKKVSLITTSQLRWDVVKNIRHLRDAWLYGTPRWVLAQTRQEACDRLETTVMRPSGTRENKQTNKHPLLRYNMTIDYECKNISMKY
jgi:hypothetical protein